MSISRDVVFNETSENEMSDKDDSFESELKFNTKEDKLLQESEEIEVQQEDYVSADSERRVLLALSKTQKKVQKSFDQRLMLRDKTTIKKYDQTNMI